MNTLQKNHSLGVFGDISRAEVIRQRVSTASNNNIINSIRSGLIRPDAHWLGLFEQAIELVAEIVLEAGAKKNRQSTSTFAV